MNPDRKRREVERIAMMDPESPEAAALAKKKFSRRRALAAFLGCKPRDVESAPYGEQVFTSTEDPGEYLVLTDKEADKAAYVECRAMLWAFNPEFLAGYSRRVDADTIRSLQESSRGEDRTADAIALLLGAANTRRAIRDGIAADGRGHTLSGYDGVENEQRDPKSGVMLFIYRIN